MGDLGGGAMGALGGAAKGAAYGSAIPVIGTGVGAIAGGILGGIGGLFGGGDEEAEKAAAARAETLRLIRELGKPPEEAKAIVMQKYTSAGNYTPEMEKNLERELTSQVEFVKDDPQVRDAQMATLLQLQKTGRTGVTDQSKADINKLRQDTEREAQGRQQAILQQAQMRGEGSAGSDLAAQLMGAQAGNERMSMAREQATASGNQNALQAIAQSGELSGNIRGQDYSQGMGKASAKDVMALAQQKVSQDIKQRNVASSNLGQQYNLDNAQSLANRNVSTANTEAVRQRTTQGSDWDRKAKYTDKLTGQSDAEATRQTAAAGAAAQGNEKMWGAVGGAVDKYGGKVSDKIAGIFDKKKPEELGKLTEDVSGLGKALGSATGILS